MKKTILTHKTHATVREGTIKYKSAVCMASSKDGQQMTDDIDSVTCPRCQAGIRQLFKTGGN